MAYIVFSLFICFFASEQEVTHLNLMVSKAILEGL